MAMQAQVINHEVAMSQLTATLGSGPAMPNLIRVTTAGSHDISTFGVPPGSDVTLSLAGSGGGGGSGDGVADGGGGGGSGGGGLVTVAAAIWSLGGPVVIRAARTGGATGPKDGGSGRAATLSIH